MKEFNEAITKAMSRIGRTVTCESFYGGGRITLVGLNSEPEMRVTYDRDGDVIKLLDSRFTQRVRHNNTFDVHRAVGLLLAEEARTIEVRRKIAENKKKEEERRSYVEWASKLTDKLRKAGVNVDIEQTYSREEQYRVSIIINNKASVMAMIDYLTDAGFLTKKEEGKPSVQ